MLCPPEGTPGRGPHQGADTAASVSRQALWPLWHINSEKMAATIRRAEADFPAREKPKNRIRGLLIEGDPGTWPSFLRTIPNFPEFLQALRDLFRVFVAVHRNFPEFCWSEEPVLQDLRINPPNYQEFLSPSRFNPRFCWFSPAKTPDKSKSFVKISEKNQLFWISMLSSFSKQPLCPI